MTDLERDYNRMVHILSGQIVELARENAELRKRPTAEYAASSDKLVKELQEQNRKLLERPTWERVTYLEKQLAQAQKGCRKRR